MIGKANSMTSLVDAVYPIGSIFISTNSTNPSNYFPGTTWSSYASGRTLLGVSSSHSAGSTGGSETVTLTTSNLPPHTHDVGIRGSSGQGYWGASCTVVETGGSKTSSSVGGGSAHNNMMPYITVYMFKRDS